MTCLTDNFQKSHKVNSKKLRKYHKKLFEKPFFSENSRSKFLIQKIFNLEFLSHAFRTNSRMTHKNIE